MVGVIIMLIVAVGIYPPAAPVCPAYVVTPDRGTVFHPITHKPGPAPGRYHWER